MKLLVLLGEVLSISLAADSRIDHCALFCNQFPHVCVQGKSACKAQVCEGLFWSRRTLFPVCNPEMEGCECADPVLCSAASSAAVHMIEFEQVSAGRRSEVWRREVPESVSIDSWVMVDAALADYDSRTAVHEGMQQKADPHGDVYDFFREEELPIERSEEELIQEAIAESLKPLHTGKSGIGRIGIRNLGNTCYLASALQILGHSARFLEALDDTTFVKPNLVQEAFVYLVSEMWDPVNSHSLNPHVLVNALWQDHRGGVRFHPETMEDAHEAIRTMLGLLSDAARLNDSDETGIERLFANSISRSRTCHGCEQTRERIEKEQDLLLSIPSPSSDNGITNLYDCFRSLGESEIIPSVECPLCERKSSATAESTLARGGDLVLVVLRRFGPDGRKIRTQVEYPVILDMKIVTNDPQAILPNYKLVGVIHHHGNSLLLGHYSSQFFHHLDEEWLEANDAFVTSRKGQLETVSGTVYILLYERN